MGKLRLSVFGASGRMGKEVTSLAKKDKDIVLLSLESRPQVVIDFSSPTGILEISRWCAINRVPLVSGTTGLSSAQQKKIKLTSKQIPILLSPNFSLGLNAMARAVEDFLSLTVPNKIAIEEVHHKNKKDNPSGTAKFLHHIIKERATTGTKVGDPKGFRRGDVFGIHEVSFFFKGELVTFSHTAQDRTIFAKGAIEVARWLVGQRPGLYKMEDYFGDMNK